MNIKTDTIGTKNISHPFISELDILVSNNSITYPVILGDEFLEDHTVEFDKTLPGLLKQLASSDNLPLTNYIRSDLLSSFAERLSNEAYELFTDPCDERPKHALEDFPSINASILKDLIDTWKTPLICDALDYGGYNLCGDHETFSRHLGIIIGVAHILQSLQDYIPPEVFKQSKHYLYMKLIPWGLEIDIYECIGKNGVLPPPFQFKAPLNKVSPSVRLAILQRDQYRCGICGASRMEDASLILEVDHKHPIAKGGDTTPENLWTLCRPCNKGKYISLEFVDVYSGC